MTESRQATINRIQITPQTQRSLQSQHWRKGKMSSVTESGTMCRKSSSQSGRMLNSLLQSSRNCKLSLWKTLWGTADSLKIFPKCSLTTCSQTPQSPKTLTFNTSTSWEHIILSSRSTTLLRTLPQQHSSGKSYPTTSAPRYLADLSRALRPRATYDSFIRTSSAKLTWSNWFAS